MNFVKKTITIAAALAAISVSSCIGASAEYYETSYRRGFWASWVNNYVTWNTKNYSRITSSDYWQTHGGIWIKEGGITKLSKSSSYMHYLNYKTIYCPGAIFRGIKLDYNMSIVDQIQIDCA